MQTLILLHGALGTAAGLLPLKAALDTHFEVLVPELPGHGISPWPDENFSIDLFSRHLLAFMDGSGVENAAVFGYSMGGFVALQAATGNPERFRSIATLATKFAWTPEAAAREAAGLDYDQLQTRAPKFIDALEKMHPAAGGRKLLQETGRMLGAMHTSVIPDEAMRQLEMPVQLLLGERDKMVGREETLHARSLLKSGSFGILPDTPHPLEAVDVTVLVALILDGIRRSRKA